MFRAICLALMCASAVSAADETLRPALEQSYLAWREAVIRKDAAGWQRTIAPHRRVEVKNRILSEKKAFPAAVFELPAPPPLAGLKFLKAEQNGATAKASYFGRVDFGVGGNPSENLLVLSFVAGGRGAWLYDRADFVNLAALPTVRRELAAGDLSYLRETPEARPSGVVPPTPIEIGPAKYIAKVYVFSPGREVRAQVNKISQHRFANAKEAEIIIGGARDGLNEVQYSIRKLEGASGREAMTLRVYLMSEVRGVQPVKVFEYQIKEGETPKSFGTGTFVVDAATVAKLAGR